MRTNDQQIRRDSTFPYCGRLIVLGADDDKMSVLDLRKVFSIDFPAMPDSIELARRAEYQVRNVMPLPDGIHQYMGTVPMEIPFEFKLHAFDRTYCKQGALTLLDIAARLHALVTPFGNTDAPGVTVQEGVLTNEGQVDQTQKPPQTEANNDKKSDQTTAGTPTADQSSQASYSISATPSYDPPVACRLELMFTNFDGPGIVCNGYVKDVKAVLHGPWLRGPDNAFNLPSSGVYSFTFVHRPGHGNFQSNTGGKAASSVQAQAYNTFIRDRLYNTRDLISFTQRRGLSDKAGGSK